MRYPKAKRILLIAVPGFGDALLATPVLRSLRAAYPHAVLDMMVRTGNESILEHNPDISNVVSVPRRPNVRGEISMLGKLFRKYDLVVSTSFSDRSFGNCMAAAGERVSVVPPLRIKDWWKHSGIQNRVLNDDSIHVVQRNLLLCDAMEIAPFSDVVVPTHPDAIQILDQTLDFSWRNEAFAVIHMLPGPPFKRWPQEHWHGLIEALSERGVRVLLTSGPAQGDVQEALRMKSHFSSMVSESAGKLSFSVLSELLREAVLYVGPDTSTTHLAAAVGAPTVALYGPTSPAKWGPWPLGYDGTETPFSDQARVQRKGNVSLIHASCHCNPEKTLCKAAGKFDSACLASILPGEVLLAIDELTGVLSHSRTDEKRAAVNAAE